MEPFPLIGASRAIELLHQELRYASSCDAKVLLTGESGVGKEVVARCIHRDSARARSRMFTINCAGVPDTLLESELFGHARGSFTDAHRDRKGWLEQADGGTVFLDEVGEMSGRMQAVLLRFLETGEIQRVGGEASMTRVNVRLITATNVRLLERVRAGQFREDLYYRINVIPINIPPLRERRDDVPLLVNHFFTQFSTLHRKPRPQMSPSASHMLMAYDWPGNVRELRNLVERLVLRAQAAPIEIEHLPNEILRPVAPAATAAAPHPPPRRAEEILFDRIVRGGESFWTVVYTPFIRRDLRREEVRELITMGLRHTHGNYKSLVHMFNMPPEDYRRFLNFLRKYDCHLAFQSFRGAVAKVMPEPFWTTRPQEGERKVGFRDAPD